MENEPKLEIADEDMAKRILGNFGNYYRKGETINEEEEEKGADFSPSKKFNKDFSIYRELQTKYGKRGQDLFYVFPEQGVRPA